MKFIGLEAEGPRFALIGNFALAIDQVDTIGPARVGPLCRVAKFVKNCRKLYIEFSHTCSSDRRAFLFVLRAHEDNLVSDVTLHLPDIVGMRLGDVDHRESDLISVLLIELVEGGSLPPKWGSGITPEYEHDRLLLVQRREFNGSALIYLQQREIGGTISNIQVPGASMGP